MSLRNEEEAALPEGELAELNDVIERFNSGEFGFYGTPLYPGLLLRLEAVQRMWEAVKNMSAKAQSNGNEVVLTMSMTEMSTLRRIFDNDVTDLDNRMREMTEAEKGEGMLNLPAMTNLLIKRHFLSHLMTACAKAQKDAIKK